MKIDESKPIGVFAAELPGAIDVFDALGIDYACLCDRPLEDAAHAEGVAPEVVISALRRLERARADESWNDRPLVDLTRFLVRAHHHFLRHELGRLVMLLSDLCTPAEGVIPELLSVQTALMGLTETVVPHLLREETALFRIIETMETAPDDFDATLREIADEHAVIAAELRTLRELRLELLDVDDLPLRIATIVEGLANVESQLRRSMFLENWFVFPRAAVLAEQPRLVER